MFDIGGSELLVIGVVALIVVGPKDLPKMFHALGQFTAKARQMAREFQRAMENAADEAGVGDVASDLKSLNSMRNLGTDTLREATKRLESWDEVKRANTAGLQPDPDAMPPAPEAAAPGPATQELAAQRAAQAEARAEAASTAKKAPAKTAAKSGTAKSTAAKPAASKAKAAPKTTATKTAAKTTAAKSAAKPAAKPKTAAKPAAKAAPKTASKAAKPAKQGDA